MKIDDIRYTVKPKDDLFVKEAAAKYDAKQVFTYADYLTWPDDERWELLDGVPYAMGAPSRKHQKILGNLYAVFHAYLKDKKCEVYFSPFDVRLKEKNKSEDDKDVTTVLQPDISIFCDLDKLDERGAIGAPDLIVETLSTSTSGYDKVVKMDIYHRHGVKEYWIVEPVTNKIIKYFLNEEGQYVVKGYRIDEAFNSHIFPDLTINVSEIFDIESETSMKKDDVEYTTHQAEHLLVKEAAVKYDAKQVFTYADYLTWPDDERWELLDGVPYVMGAPSGRHQEISSALSLIFATYLKDKSCKVFTAPLDVRLGWNGHDDLSDVTCVQPDLMILCDKRKFSKKGILGAPDLVVEILSPSTMTYDLLTKMEKYQNVGIKEYWAIEPALEKVSVYLLNENGKYEMTIYNKDDVVKVSIFADFVVNIAEIFADSWLTVEHKGE